MAVKANVRTKRVTATGAIGFGRSRLIGLNIVTGATAGRLTITNGVGGATILDLDTQPSTAVYYRLPDAGILSDNDPAISTLTNITSVTVMAY